MSLYRIAAGGESAFHIVAHQYADETVRYAASELQKYLLKSTGAVVNYFADCCPMRGPEIRVGADVRGETSVETALAPDGFAIRAAGEHITITGSTTRGVLYGVYRFLELFCGFRCFTKDCEVIDTMDLLEIELDEIIEQPAFEYREAYFRHAFDGDFCAKNRLNANLGDLSAGKGGRMKWYNFHHSFKDLVPEEVWFDTHPEYFSEIDGERRRNSQLCLANPEVLELSRRKLRAWIRDNPECTVFSIGQNDNYRRCTCEKCLAIEAEEGSPAGPMIRFVNALADDIRADYPDILLHTFAYQYTLPAPKLAVARDNVIVRLCSISCRFDQPFETLSAANPDGAERIFTDAIDAWQTHASRLYVWDYAVNFANYAQPMFHFHAMAENVRYFARKHVRGVLQQGNFAYGGGCAGDDLKSYLIAKLLWNPDADIDAAIHEFCAGVYGAAGAQMEAYFRRMEAACSASPLSIYQKTDAAYITDALIAECEDIFTCALEAADTEKARRRVEREQLAVRFVRLTRTPLDAAGRSEAVEQFIRDVKSHGITELMERTPLSVTRASMLTGLYGKERQGYYRLYYIMQ